MDVLAQGMVDQIVSSTEEVKVKQGKLKKLATLFDEATGKEIQVIAAKLVSKSYTPKVKLYNGGLVPPKLIFKDAIPAFRKLLDEYEAHPDAKTYAEAH